MLVSAEQSKFKINRLVAALSRSNPGVSSAFLLLLSMLCLGFAMFTTHMS